MLKEIIDKNLCLEDATIIFGLLVKYLPNNYYLIKQYFNSDGELIKFSVSSILKDQLLKVENTLSLEHFQYMETFGLLASTILENYDKLLNQEEKGYKSIEEIEYAILENNGTLSVFPFTKRLGSKKSSPLPLPVILDTNIQEDTLKLLNKDEAWLRNILRQKNLELEDIFYAFYKNGELFIIKDNELI